MQKKALFKNGLGIIIGALIYAVTINDFLIPHHIGEGGVTGLTAIGYYALAIPPAATNLVLNGLLVIVGFKYLEKQTIWYSVWAVLWISIFLRLPHFIGYHTTQTIIPTIIGGVLMGIAMAIIIHCQGTIAGSTILAKIANRYLGIQNGSAMLFFDLIVAIPSGFIIGFQNMLLTIIELYLSAVVLNKLLAKFGVKRAVMIISDQYATIAQTLSTQFHQGITIIKAQGYYSQNDRPMLYVICTAKQLATLVPVVSTIDQQALVVVEEVRSVQAEQLKQLL
ncbi:membrane protein [Latilactobacillus curvatus]|uniref:Membrane protein n=1 Tax=Latilactobacillus curvatus TaxID=28038 RepID=A0ABN6GG68_LATCU|nr:YitT family protein [Latilactobacillus curvatus]BCX29864.1 membrane protein [Latilactobacillus curvatus]